MKNLNYLLFSAVAVTALTVSCRRQHNDEEAVTKVVEVTLSANETYTYVMPPAGGADEVMEITQQAKHYLVSELTVDAQRNTTIEYTPELNYTGTDEVRVNTVEIEPQHGGCGDNNGGNNQGGFGNCIPVEPIPDNYVFIFTITEATQQR